ncbi:MAG: YceI family protein [Cyclobacteriaceae bacterium]
MKKIILGLFSIILLLVFSAFNIPEGTYSVDSQASKLRWTGYHLAKSYEHTGFVTIKSGKLEVSGGLITGGNFVIDMNTITNEDLTSAKDNAKLVNHLKSKDFFNVKQFPEAKLVIKNSNSSGSGLKVNADLTIRGITKPITFDATLTENGNTVEANATLTIVRTDYEVMYGWKVENAMLSGEFKMDVKLVAKK